MINKKMIPKECRYTQTCPFHANWVGYTHKNRTDVIIRTSKDGDDKWPYDCLTLIALEDAETGIPFGQKLRDELKEGLPNEVRNNCPLNESNQDQNYLETRKRELLKRFPEIRVFDEYHMAALKREGVI